MFFGQPFPVLMAAGVLNPVTTELIIKGVKNGGAGNLVAGEVLCFDFKQSVATSWSPSAGPASVFGCAITAPADSATSQFRSVAVAGVVQATATAPATCDLLVIGLTTSVVRVTGTSTKGDTFILTDAAKTVSPTSGTITGAKIIGIANATTATTATNLMFNGFGFGHN